MRPHLVEVTAHVTQPVMLNIPIELWERLREITPSGFSVQDTVIVAVQAFVDEETSCSR